MITRQAIMAARDDAASEGQRKFAMVPMLDFLAVCNVIDAMNEEIEELKREIAGLKERRL